MSFFFNLFQAPSALEMAPTALETIGFLGKSKRFSYFANYLKPDRSTDVCVLLLAVTTADPLAQLEKVAEKFDLRADASFFLKDLCGPTP